MGNLRRGLMDARVEQIQQSRAFDACAAVKNPGVHIQWRSLMQRLRARSSSTGIAHPALRYGCAAAASAAAPLSGPFRT